MRMNNFYRCYENSDMSENFLSLTKHYHASYEVSPYYVEIEDRHVGLPATTRTVQAGFSVDVYGVKNRKE